MIDSNVLSTQRRRLLLVASLTALGSNAAWARTVGSGRLQSETRPVAEFDAIAVSDGIDLVVRQGGQEALSLSADDNLLPLIETTVEPGSRGRTLHIRIRRGESTRTRNPITATVDVVKLQALAAAGSGTMKVAALKTPSLHLSMAGSSDARLESLSTDKLDVRIAGSGNVRANGNAGQVKVSVSGSGDVDLASLVADEVTISIAGSGNAKVTANKSLSVSIAGSGDVVYGGAATAVRSSVAGSGKISKRAASA